MVMDRNYEYGRGIYLELDPYNKEVFTTKDVSDIYEDSEEFFWELPDNLTEEDYDNLFNKIEGYLLIMLNNIDNLGNLEGNGLDADANIQYVIDNLSRR